MEDDFLLHRLARLISVPSRAAMLLALADGRALPAGELAFRAKVSNQTASEHLTRMKEEGVVESEKCGRHRYYRVSSIRMIETIEDLLAASAEISLRDRPDRSRVDPLRAARMCYDHLAGRLGVSLSERFLEAGWVSLEEKDYSVTEIGWTFLASIGIDRRILESSRRLFARRCIDWSERKPHIGGALGAAMAARFMELDWIRRSPDSRVVYATHSGRKSFEEHYGLIV